MYNVESLGLNEAELVVEATLEEVLKELKQPVAMAVADNRGSPNLLRQNGRC
jgi:hypothetical protein